MGLIALNSKVQSMFLPPEALTNEPQVKIYITILIAFEAIKYKMHFILIQPYDIGIYLVGFIFDAM